MTIQSPEYDGPKVRHDHPMAWFSAIPIVGVVFAAGALMFLFIQRNKREVTKTPAEARGSVNVFFYSHLVYLAIALIVVVFL